VQLVLNDQDTLIEYSAENFLVLRTLSVGEDPFPYMKTVMQILVIFIKQLWTVLNMLVT